MNVVLKCAREGCGSEALPSSIHCGDHVARDVSAQYGPTGIWAHLAIGGLGVLAVGFIIAVATSVATDIGPHRRQLEDARYRLSPEGKAETNRRLIEQCKFEGGTPVVWFDTGEYIRCKAGS